MVAFSVQKEIYGFLNFPRNASARFQVTRSSYIVTRKCCEQSEFRDDRICSISVNS
jgi:hypothetical protein